MKKLTIEQMRHFFDSLANVLVKDGKLAFEVLNNGKRNKFILCIKKDKLLFRLGCYYKIKDIKTIAWSAIPISCPSIDVLFEKAHDDIMLRSQSILVKDLVDKYGLPEDEVYCCIIRHLKGVISKTRNFYYNDNKKAYIFAYISADFYVVAREIGFNTQYLASTSDFKTFEELLINTDLENIK